MVNLRRWALATLSAMGAVVVVATAAWACVSGPGLNLSTATAKAGQEVGVSGTSWRFKADPVTIRFNALDGPVLGTAPVTGGNFSTTVKVPESAKPGNYVIIVSQHAPDGSLSQVPTRALLTVVGETGASPVLGAAGAATPELRPDALVRSDESISGAALALIALGVASLGLFGAGMAVLLAGRRGAVPTAAKVRS